MTSLVRKQHLAMAQSRAVEEEAERYNPVNPKEMTHNRKENANRLSGQGATPSMGLSQYRGGKKHTLVDHLNAPNKGFGTGAGEHSEAHEMGKHLGTHLKNLHGGAFHKAFLHGMGRVDDDAEPEGYTRPETQFDEEGFRVPSSGTVNEVRRAAANKNYMDKASTKEKLAQGALGVLSKAGKKAAQNLHKVIPGSEEVGQTISDLIPNVGSGSVSRAKTILGQKKPGRTHNNGVPLLSGNVDGVRSGGGEMLTQPLPISGTNLLLSGSSMTGAYEGQGKTKLKRVVGAGDGRRKRAEVVKRVMKEKGMKMIEASKYVKQHNLY